MVATRRILCQRKRAARLQRQKVVLRLLGIDISRFNQRAIQWLVLYSSGQPMGDSQFMIPNGVRREDLAIIDQANRAKQDAIVEQGT